MDIATVYLAHAVISALFIGLAARSKGKAGLLFAIPALFMNFIAAPSGWLLLIGIYLTPSAKKVNTSHYNVID